MTTIRRKLGDLGEKLAEEYLEKQGYEIVDRNYQKRSGEIDLIARKNKIIIFSSDDDNLNRKILEKEFVDQRFAVCQKTKNKFYASERGD